MRVSLRSIFSAVSLSIFLSTGAGQLSQAFAAAPPPSLPEYYVLDQPRVLSRPMTEALQRLLVEHDHLTGEQVVIAIFDDLDHEKPEKRAREIFTRWKLGQRGSDNGALLAVFWKEQKSQLIMGYGLDPAFPEARVSEILTRFLAPELRSAQPDRAFALTTLELLRTLGSPLMENGKAQSLLWDGGFRGSWRPQKNNLVHWSIWIVLGVGLMGAAFILLTSAEAHFSRDGWYRPRPWKNPFQWGKETQTHAEGGASGAW